MTKARRSRLALFEQTRDVVFGVGEGTRGERGLLVGGYSNHRGDRVSVCLNSALYAAERDLFVGDQMPANKVADKEGPTGGMRTREGEDTQRELALAILDLHPTLGKVPPPGESVEDVLRSNPRMAHHVIVSFNDSVLGQQTHAAAADLMAEALAQCEKRIFENWVADHPDFQRGAGRYEYDKRSFVDFAVTKD